MYSSTCLIHYHGTIVFFSMCPLSFQESIVCSSTSSDSYRQTIEFSIYPASVCFPMCPTSYHESIVWSPMCPTSYHESIVCSSMCPTSDCESIVCSSRCSASYCRILWKLELWLSHTDWLDNCSKASESPWVSLTTTECLLYEFHSPQQLSQDHWVFYIPC